jgi:diacylglycerol kinase (ATP)
MDLGRVNGRYFATVACAGFDAEVARAVHENVSPLPGAAGYVMAVLRTLVAHRDSRIRIEGQGWAHDGPAFLTAVGNTGVYGGGMEMLPQAECGDGALDLCVVSGLTRLEALCYLPRVYSGSHADLPAVEMARSTWFHLTTEKPRWVYADGEPVCQTPARFEVAPGVLQIICPRSG